MLTDGSPSLLVRAEIISTVSLVRVTMKGFPVKGSIGGSPRLILS